MAAIERAIAIRSPFEGVIHHSDQSSQYRPDAYQKKGFKIHSFIISMSGKDNCFDNARVETALRAIKAELYRRIIHKASSLAIQAIGAYINAF